VIATKSEVTDVSPKAHAIQQIKPVAFVDDFLPYFRGIHSGTHQYSF
jgi:hypothetical protein